MGHIIKAYLILISLGLIIAGIGKCPREQRAARKPWLPYIEQDADIRGKQSSPRATRKYSERPWETAKQEQTEEWADFLETLENRGYDVWDPEAEDIWGQEY